MEQINPYNENANKKIYHRNITPLNYYKVDIIIPFYKNYGQTVSLVETIFRRIKNVDFNIVLVNDGVKNNQFEQMFKDLKKIKIVNLSCPKGFGACVNKGLEYCNNDLVVVMHNDVHINDNNFLINLIKDLIGLSNKKVVSVSSSTNNFMNKKFKEFETNEAKADPPFIFEQKTLSPFICTIFFKNIIQQIGGFPEYPICWFEGDLVGLKLLAKGFKQALSKKSFVLHDGGGTILNILNENQANKELIKKNYEKFCMDRKLI